MELLLVIDLLATATLAVLVAGVLRSHAELLRLTHLYQEAPPGNSQMGEVAVTAGGLELSERLSVQSAIPLHGESAGDGAATHFNVESDPASGETLLAFLSTSCMTCEPFWASLAETAEPMDLDPPPQVVIVARDRRDESPSRLQRLVPSTVPTILSSAAWREYGIPVSPYFILASSSGAILGYGTARNWSQVEKLCAEAAADRRALAGVAAGETSPRR